VLVKGAATLAQFYARLGEVLGTAGGDTSTPS
jgi:hypothetical protein